MAGFFLSLLCLLPSALALQDPKRAAGRKGYPFGRRQPLHVSVDNLVEIPQIQHVERSETIIAQTEKTKSTFV
jgi:hypothetical protein